MNNIWEQFYKTRNRYYLVPHPNFNKVINKFKLYKVHKVLDLGCGSGRHSIALAKNGFKIIGIDNSKEALKLARSWAKKENLKIEFDLGDIFKPMKYKDDSFDGIIAIDSIHYESSESLKSALKESARILRNKGMIFITIPTKIVNPLITHMIYTKEEIGNLVSRYFKIIDKFLDEAKFYCVFGIK